MTTVSFCQKTNHRDPLLPLPGFVQKQPPEVSCKKGVLKNLANFTGKRLLESLFNKVAGLQVSKFIEKRLQHWCFSVKYAIFSGTPILKNIYERLLLFVSPQNIIANSSGEFGLDETSTECKVVFFLNSTVLFDHLYISFKNVSLTFQLTFLLDFLTRRAF